jgi:hypothetical protein
LQLSIREDAKSRRCTAGASKNRVHAFHDLSEGFVKPCVRKVICRDNGDVFGFRTMPHSVDDSE